MLMFLEEVRNLAEQTILRAVQGIYDTISKVQLALENKEKILHCFFS